MEKKDNKYLYVLTLILAVAVVGLSVAYAALSSTLTAKFNTVSQAVATWNVGFDTSMSTAGVPGGTSTDTITCGAANITAGAVTIGNTSIGKPGDYCRYALKVKNIGDIDAKLSQITFIQPSGGTCTTSGATMVCGDITYKITIDEAGSNQLAIDRVLAKQTGELPIWLHVVYSGASLATDTLNLTNGGFSLYYVQN